MSAGGSVIRSLVHSARLEQERPMTVTRSTRRSLGGGAVKRALAEARRRRVLAKMEYKLSRTDPLLASKFEMFSRLADREAMPWIEQMTASTPCRTGKMTRIGDLSYLLRVVVCVAVAAGALAATLLAGGAALARRAPVRAARGYSVQSANAPHPARPAAGNGPAAPVTQNQFHARRQAKRRSAGANGVCYSPARIVRLPGANGRAGLAGGDGHGRAGEMSGPLGTPPGAAESWQEVRCAR
jgi:hypothetical protein